MDFIDYVECRIVKKPVFLIIFFFVSLLGMLILYLGKVEGERYELI